MSKLAKTAFTLIELLVVIAIIGILSGLIIVTMNGVTAKANIAKSQIFSNSLRNALMLNIVGEWKMDEGSGVTANDTWGGLNNGTLSGFTSTVAGAGDAGASGWMSSINCISGTCLKFDGVDDYVDCGAGSNLNIASAITMSAWAKHTNDNSEDEIIGKWGTVLADKAYVMGVNSSNKLFSKITTSAGEDYAFDANIISADWVFCTATFDITNGLILYKNGIEVDRDATYKANINSTSSTFKIGDIDIANLNWKGSIEDVKIYNSAMPTSQIKEQYFAGLNSLFLNGGITKEEYLSRINNYASNN